MTTQTIKPTVTRRMKMSAYGDAMAESSIPWFAVSLYISLPAGIVIGLFHLLGFLAPVVLVPSLAATLVNPAMGVLLALGSVILNALAGKVAAEQWAAFYEYYDDEN